MLQSRRNVPLQDIKSRMRSFFRVLSACLANVLGLLLHQVPHENPHRDMCINGAFVRSPALQTGTAAANKSGYRDIASKFHSLHGQARDVYTAGVNRIVYHSLLN
jgi:hypothetical protein